MKRRRAKTGRTLSSIYQSVLAAIYMLVLVSGAALSYGAYINERNTIIKETELILNDLSREYSTIIGGFSSVYMPVFENRDTYQTIYDYFFATSPDTPPLSPPERKSLADALKQMMGRDARAVWIALYAPHRPDNYILFSSDSSLTEMDDSFPFYQELRNKKSRQELYGTKSIQSPGAPYLTFAVSGGISREMGDGAVIIGYRTGVLDQIIQSSPVRQGIRYTIRTPDFTVYDSDGQYEHPLRSSNGNGPIETDRWLYSRSIVRTGGGYTVSYHLPWQDLSLRANRYTPTILLACFALMLLARLLYSVFTTRIFRQVELINSGLEKLGDNRLDTRLPENCDAGELDSISISINHMAAKLQSLIENEYVYSIRQKEAELAELQAKFDPHFLYNSLEIIRGRVYENGDAETADIIKKLSQLFRSLLSDKRFVTIADEVAFCSSYFSLFKTPQTDNIQVIYDVDSHLLLYGIVRNLLQPVIENYFVHGFDIHSPDNRITIRCKEEGRDRIRLQIIDNGLGITQQRLEELTQQMQDAKNTTDGGHGYGLTNLAQRIRLMYGPACGLTITKNDDQGVCVSLIIKKMSCQQLESHFHLAQKL